VCRAIGQQLFHISRIGLAVFEIDRIAIIIDTNRVAVYSTLAQSLRRSRNGCARSNLPTSSVSHQCCAFILRRGPTK